MVEKQKQGDRSGEEDRRRVDREMMQGMRAVDREMNVRDMVGKLREAVGMRLWMAPVGMMQLYGKDLKRDEVGRK